MATGGAAARQLTVVEERLLQCVVAGEELDLGVEGAGWGEEEMKSWGADRSVRAVVIRDIVRGRLADDPDPRGLRLRGARVVGTLDLRQVIGTIPLALVRCYLPDGARFDDAQLQSLGLYQCRIAHGINLAGAHIANRLNMSGATVMNDLGPALNAERLRVDGNLDLRHDFTATGTGELGAVRLSSAHINGQLDASGAKLTNDSGPALQATGLQVDGSLYLNHVTATGTGEEGAVRLSSAHVGGQLIAPGAKLTNDSGPALNADVLQVGADLYLDDDFTAAGSSELGAVRLIRAHVSGELSASGAKVTNDSGPALAGDGIQVDGGMFLRGDFTGTGELGAVRLLSAHISHHLDATRTTITNNSGTAFDAEGLQVDGGMFLRGGFTATGTGELGAVQLSGAHISGQMDASSATITNNSGPALHAERLRVDGDLFLNDGFIATGGSNGDAVRLSAAHIGSLNIDLSGIHNSGGGPGQLRVDGLVYTGLPVGPTVAEWLAVLAHRTPGYAAQPYRQLADATRAAGHDGDTRKILIAQRRDQLDRRAVTARPERAWVRFTGVLLGFGYQPWRALLWLLAVVGLAITLTIIGGDHGGLARTERTGSAGTPCATVERVGVGIDLGLPLIKTTARDTCTTTTTPAGRIITAAGWALQLAAWALATLFIAGFTGAVRKT